MLRVSCLAFVSTVGVVLGVVPTTSRLAAAEPEQSPPPDLSTRPGADWPAFLGPTADGKSPETGLITPWPAAGPRLVWQQRVGVGYGMPAISRGRLFQFDRHGDTARVSCLKAESGEFIWKFEYATDYQDTYGYDNGPRCCPVVDGDRVYTFGAEGMLHCLRAVDGAVVWKIDTSREYGVVQNFFGVGSTPIVEGDLLIVQIGGSPPEAANVPRGQLDQVRGNGTGIVAFDKFTGRERYRLSDELASYAVPTAATIDGRRWCFVFTRGGLLGFEPSRGVQDFFFPWRAPILESVNASNPVVIGDRVLVSECYGPGSAVVRVRPGGHDVIWQDEDRSRNKALQTHWNTPVYVDGFLYASSGRHTGGSDLRCVRFDTGEVMWREQNDARSSFTYVDGHLICLTEDGELLLLRANPEKFDLVSRFTPMIAAEVRPPLISSGEPSRMLNYPAWAAPAVARGLLYVRGANRLACFEIIPAAAR